MLILWGCGERPVYERYLGEEIKSGCLKIEEGGEFYQELSAEVKEKNLFQKNCAYTLRSEIHFATCEVGKRPAGSALGVMRLEIADHKGQAVYQIQQEFDESPTAGQAAGLLKRVLKTFIVPDLPE